MMIRALTLLVLLASPLRADPVLVLPIPPDATSRAISVVAAPGLTRTRSLPPGELRTAREAMLADQDISPDLMRQLADRQDGLAALRYHRHLLETGGSASDIAYYGAIAVMTGRIWPLEDVVAALLTLDPATEPPDRVNLAIRALYPQAWAGNGLALDALIQLNGEDRLFGVMSDATRARLVDAARAGGDGRLFLHLAVSELWGTPDADARARAQAYLAEAAAGSHLGVRTTAQTLLIAQDNAARAAGLVPAETTGGAP
jgi:hypothetical protein